MATGLGRDGRFVAGPGSGDHLVVADGAVIDGKLEHPVEDHAAAA